MSDPNWLFAEHQRRNRTTLDAHSRFTDHRQRVMHLLRQSAVANAERLCVLGAGNCNDLDLVELLGVFGSIELVDLDRTAPESAVTNIPEPSLRERVRVADSLDVTGAFGRLQDSDIKDMHSSAANDVLSLLSTTPRLPESPFDCVISTCLLSQLIDSVVLALGINHPSIVPIIIALRRQHFRTLIQNLSVGGRAVCVFDFVSSQSLAGLMRIEENRLKQTLIEAINAKNFFTGLNPFAVQADLQSHPEFAGLITDIRLHPPWRWDIGKKQFAVAAISFRRD